MPSIRLMSLRATLALALAAGGLLAVPTGALAQSEEASLARGAMPDTTHNSVINPPSAKRAVV